MGLSVSLKLLLKFNSVRFILQGLAIFDGMERTSTFLQLDDLTKLQTINDQIAQKTFS